LKRANEANHRANTRDSFGKMAKVCRSKGAAVSVGKFVNDQVAGGLVEARRRHIDNLNSTDRCFGGFFTCCILNATALDGVVSEVVFRGQESNVEKPLAWFTEFWKCSAICLPSSPFVAISGTAFQWESKERLKNVSSWFNAERDSEVWVRMVGAIRLM
jgi:hypothetical protein